jgi:hypothetical protein
MSIHSQDEQVVLEFGLKKPAFRVVVNSPATHGSIGLTTGLDPAMTLGCGGYGGNITSDNISPRHLLNIKRLAYEISPVPSRFERAGAARSERAAAGAIELPLASSSSGSAVSGSAVSGSAVPGGITAEALSAQIDKFLGRRGYRPEGTAPGVHAADPRPLSARTPDQAPLEFVCEDDVRVAIQAGRMLVVSERAIVTPAARDLGEQHRVFSIAPWRG